MIDIMENKILGPAIRKGTDVVRAAYHQVGPLPEAVLARLRRASETELSSWVDRVLTAYILGEVIA